MPTVVMFAHPKACRAPPCSSTSRVSSLQYTSRAAQLYRALLDKEASKATPQALQHRWARGSFCAQHLSLAPSRWACHGRPCTAPMPMHSIVLLPHRVPCNLESSRGIRGSANTRVCGHLCAPFTCPRDAASPWRRTVHVGTQATWRTSGTSRRRQRQRHPPLQLHRRQRWPRCPMWGHTGLRTWGRSRDLHPSRRPLPRSVSRP